jgi:hypothetical protein
MAKRAMFSSPRAASMNAMAAVSTARPNGIQLKKSSGARPRLRKVPSIIMFGEDAIRVIIPLISVVTDSGMSMRLLFRQRRNMWWYRGEAKVGDVLVAEAELSAYLVKE